MPPLVIAGALTGIWEGWQAWGADFAAVEEPRSQLVYAIKSAPEWAVLLVVLLLNGLSVSLTAYFQARKHYRFTLRRDSDSMLAEIRRLEAECGRLREAARVVCESTDASAVQLGLKMLRAAIAPQEPAQQTTPPTSGGAQQLGD